MVSQLVASDASGLCVCCGTVSILALVAANLELTQIGASFTARNVSTHVNDLKQIFHLLQNTTFRRNCPKILFPFQLTWSDQPFVNE